MIELQGRELEIEVERVVFGRNVESIRGVPMWVGEAGTLPGSPNVLSDGREAHRVRHFLDDPGACMAVIFRMEEKGFWYSATSPHGVTMCWVATFLPKDDSVKLWVEETGDTLAEAVCRAAVCAIRSEVLTRTPNGV